MRPLLRPFSSARASSTFAALVLCAATLSAGAADDEGGLDTAGFHSPLGYFAAAALSDPTDAGFAVTPPVVDGDWTIFAYSNAATGALSWQIVTPISQFSPCTLALAGAAFHPTDARFDREGRLVIAGSARYETLGSVLFAARFLYPACTLDADFDGDGYFTFDFPTDIDGARIALQRIGAPPFDFEKLLLGATVRYASQPDASDLLFVRLDEDGSFDGGFDGDGIVVRDFDGDDNDLAAVEVDSQNGLVFAGTVGFGATGDALVGRMLGNGALDTAFGAGGFRRFDQHIAGLNDHVADLVRAPNGDLYLAGNAFDSDDNWIVATRLSGGNGSTLAHETWPTLNFFFLEGAVLQGDLRLILSGSAFTESDLSLFTLARTIPDLALDPTYNDLDDNNPLSLAQLGLAAHPYERARGIALSGGRPVVAGFATGDTPGSYRPFLARLESGYIFADGFESGSRSAW